jgi:hypothetical protein
MKYARLKALYDEWIDSVNSGTASRTFCAVEERNTELETTYYLLGFNMDKTKSLIFQGTYGLMHDYGCIAITHLLDLSNKKDKKFFDSKNIEFGDIKKLDKFHK